MLNCASPAFRWRHCPCRPLEAGARAGIAVFFRSPRAESGAPLAAPSATAILPRPLPPTHPTAPAPQAPVRPGPTDRRRSLAAPQRGRSAGPASRRRRPAAGGLRPRGEGQARPAGRLGGPRPRAGGRSGAARTGAWPRRGPVLPERRLAHPAAQGGAQVRAAPRSLGGGGGGVPRGRGRTGCLGLWPAAVVATAHPHPPAARAQVVPG
jgi:zinc finger/BTB domain-containing protein 10